jgi:hypothetical protein
MLAPAAWLRGQAPRDMPAGKLSAPHVLFDGTTLQHFRTPAGATSPSVSWRIADGALESIPNARRECDLWTAAEYDNFDLEFDWKVGLHGNSGVKYMIQAPATDRLQDEEGEYIHESSLGFEFQLVDDHSPAANDPKHVSGALYNYLPPAQRASHPTGEWNSARLLVSGEHIEHWINGKRILAYSLQSSALKSALAANRAGSARLLERLAKRKTPIAFQHHHSSVAFRSIRIRT